MSGQPSSQKQPLPWLDEHFARRTVLFLLIASLALTVTFKLVFWFLHPDYVSADQSVYLECAELILKGQVPYRDFFEFNPPLIMYLNVIPVALAHLMRWPDALGLNFTVHVFHIVCVAMVALLIFRFRQCLRPFVFVPVLFVCAYYTQLLISDNGQREHIFTIAFLPWFFLRGVRYSGFDPGRPLSIVAALIAGVFMSLKPQFAFIILASECGYLLETRHWRALLKPEIAWLFLPPLIYGLAFICLPQEAIKIFFEQALTAYSYGSSWGARCSTFMVMGSSYLTEPMYQFIAALFVAITLRRVSPWIVPFAMICLAAFVNYVSGGQAWTYRLLPLAFFSQMLLALELGLLLEYLYERYKSRVDGLHIYAVLAVFCFVAYQVTNEITYAVTSYESAPKVNMHDLGWWGYNPRPDYDETFFAIMQNSKQGDKVIHMGSGIRPGYPCQLQSDRPPGSRYLYTYLLTMILAAKEKYPMRMKEFDRLENQMLKNLGEDILKNKPVLIFIQDAPIQQILDRHKFIAQYMNAYSRIGVADGCDIYRHTGGKVNLPAITPEMRQGIVMAVLSHEKTVIEISSENNLPSKLVQDWVDRSKAAIKDALIDRSLDPEAQMKEEIESLNSRLWEQAREIEQLKETRAREQAAKAPPTAP